MASRTVAPLLAALLTGCLFDQNPDFDGPASASSSTGDDSVGATSTTAAPTTDAPTTDAPTTAATASSDPTDTGETTATTVPVTSTTTEPALCGNGILEEGEACDDGAENGPGQYCTAECVKNTCGDGDKGPAEVCDDGNEDNTDLCSIDCLPVPTDVAFADPIQWIPPIGNVNALYTKKEICPAGRALVGFHARTNLLGKWIAWLKPVCADLYVLPKGEGYAIHTDEPATVGNGIGDYILQDPNFELLCSLGQVVFGADTGFKDELGNFALKCTLLDVVPGLNTYEVIYGLQTTLGSVGMGPVGMMKTGACPPGQVVTAVEVGYKVGIRYLKLGCQQPYLVPK